MASRSRERFGWGSPRTKNTPSDHDAVIRSLRLRGAGGLFETDVASVNLGDNPMWEALAEMAKKGVTVFGCQEGLDRTLRMGLPGPFADWRKFAPESVAAANAVPLLWDSEVWARTFAHAILSAGRRYLGPAGAGPTYMHAKVVNVVVLKHRETGVKVRFINFHLPPSYTRDLPGEAEDRNRDQLVSDILDDVVRVAKRSRIPVVFFADLNGTEHEAPGVYNRLKEAGFRGFTVEPTKDRRAIDHVGVRPKKVS